MAGLISWLRSSHFDNCETNILGASREQSSKAYSGMKHFWDISELSKKLLIKEPLAQKTNWLNGSVVQILAASQRSVRGPHPQNLILDEVDEIDFDIYEAALSQPLSKNNIPASLGLFSTVHKIDGTMSSILDKESIQLYKYCVWECLESCRNYSCSTCKLSEFCPGKQMKDASGYYKISDFILKLETLSLNSIKLEWFCEKIGIGDTVYQEEYDSDIHLITRDFSERYDVYLSVDWGGVHPFSVGAWQNFPDIGWVRVDEVYMANTTNQRLIEETKKRKWWKNVIDGVADPSRPDLIMEWADIDLNGSDKKKRIVYFRNEGNNLI